MFKVICIDDNWLHGPDPSIHGPKIGEIVEVFGSWIFEGVLYYDICGYTFPPLETTYEANQFIPLSDIDERELVQHRELAGVRESIEAI